MEQVTETVMFCVRMAALTMVSLGQTSTSLPRPLPSTSRARQLTRPYTATSCRLWLGYRPGQILLATKIVGDIFLVFRGKER